MVLILVGGGTIDGMRVCVPAFREAPASLQMLRSHAERRGRPGASAVLCLLPPPRVLSPSSPHPGAPSPPSLPVLLPWLPGPCPEHTGMGF